MLFIQFWFKIKSFSAVVSSSWAINLYLSSLDFCQLFWCICLFFSFLLWSRHRVCSLLSVFLPKRMVPNLIFVLTTFSLQPKTWERPGVDLRWPGLSSNQERQHGIPTGKDQNICLDYIKYKGTEIYQYYINCWLSIKRV